MKDFYRERDQIEKEAIEFLKEGLFADRPDDCPKYVHFAIAAHDKAQWQREYQKGVLCFKTLFHTGEERYRMALWNMVVNYYAPMSKFCRKDFSKEEYAFIKSAMKAITEPTEANINPPIETERLILRAIEGEDRKILADHFKSEGDFEFFTGIKPTNKNIRDFSTFLRRNTYFAIERRSDRTLLGYIGLSIKEASATGLLEYYLFKDERRKGYCKEAIEALTQIALCENFMSPWKRCNLAFTKRKSFI